MSSMEVPNQSTETIKVPTAHYEFGANFLDPKVCSMTFNIIVAPITLIFLTRFAAVVDAHWEGDDRWKA